MTDVTSTCPPRPHVPILENVTIYFPQGDTTFIVGGSGSGKSTVAHLLAGMYSHQDGQITLDHQDIQVLNEKFGKMTHLCVADRDRLANDVACSGGFCAQFSLMLLRLLTLGLHLCVDLLLLRYEIICVFLCLEGV